MPVLQYFAFAWDAADTGQSRVACELIAECRTRLAHWHLRLNQPGLAVASTADDLDNEPQLLHGEHSAYREHGSHGVIIGRVWRKPGINQHDTAEIERLAMPADLTAPECEHIEHSAGRELVERFWGDYVAFFDDQAKGTKWVLRAPATLLPCLHVRHRGVEVYFSCMDLLAKLLGARFSINWNYVARALIGPHRTPLTGLNEVREVPCGTCEQISFGGESVAVTRTARNYWHPLATFSTTACSRTNQLSHFDAATRALRESARYCVHARTAVHLKVLVALSGGLDSSVVLACLHSAPSRPQIVCLTHFTPRHESDERRFARLAAHQAGCELIEVERTADIDLRRMLSPVRFERSTGFHTPDIDRIDPSAARGRGASAIFRGHGGDELFCRHHTSLYLADFVRDRGLRPGFVELALHCAVLEGETFWMAAGRALRDAWFPRQWNFAMRMWHEQEGQSTLEDECVVALLKGDESGTSLFNSSNDTPPGRRWQLSLVTSWRPYATPFAQFSDPSSISPLLSQPLIETCMRIPTWLQTTGRRDRAVTRAAFRQDLPAQIIDRRGKGGAETLAWEMVARNRAFVREMLLDGQLARRGIVNRARIEAALSDSASPVFKGTAPLLDLLAMEAWLWSWSGTATF